MKKFQQNLSRELKRSNPDRLKLESQCISAIAFGADDMDDEDTDGLIRDDPLRCPLWIIVINIVAMEMLRSKLPPGNNCGHLSECYITGRPTQAENILPTLFICQIYLLVKLTQYNYKYSKVEQKIFSKFHNKKIQ